MMIKHVTFVAICAACASAAGAATIRYDFSGNIGSSPPSLFGPSGAALHVDSGFGSGTYSGFITFDIATPDVSATPGSQRYAARSLSATVGNLTFTASNGSGYALYQPSTGAFALVLENDQDVSGVAGVERGRFVISATSIVPKPGVVQSASNFLFATIQAQLATGATVPTYSETLVNGFKLAPIFSVTTQAIPEPETWAMMIGGFGIIGAAARRRSHRRVTHT